MTIEQGMQEAVQHFFAGRLPEAEVYVRDVLAQQPHHAAALHMMGLIAHKVGRNEVAAELVERSTQLDRSDASAFSNLAEIYRALGRFSDAITAARQAAQMIPDHAVLRNNLGNAYRDARAWKLAADTYRQVIDMRPDFIDARCNLGLALKELGDPQQAITAYRGAIETRPDYEPAYAALASLLKGQSRVEEAVAAYEKRVALLPSDAEAHLELGLALQSANKLPAAADAFRKAIELRPDHAEAYNQLGVTLQRSAQLKESLAALRKAVELKADSGSAWHNLALTLQSVGKLDEAIAAYEKAAVLRPRFAETHGNLGNLLRESGRLEEAITAYRKAVELKPDWAAVQSALLYLLHSDPRFDAEAIFNEHRRWYRQTVKQFEAPPIRTDRTPDRKLRIGYVSADFRQHPIAHTLLPLLQSHDKTHYEAICYSAVRKPDSTTEQLRGRASAWRNIAGMSDAKAAELIGEDRIDILVDLSLHMPGNRLSLFARKPTPVQITHLGYPSTTGLATVDYRLSDPNLDPPGFNDTCFSEQTLRLPDCFWCYDPLGEAPVVGPLPARAAGYVTFACFSPFHQITLEALQLWSKVLRALPGSRIVLQALDGSHQQRVRGEFAKEGVAGTRVEFVGRKTRDEQLRLHQRIDVALDTFPFGGQSTTCDALWMGVPVVTRPGKTAVSRAGLSLLSNVGLGRLVAWAGEEYLRIATDLARDLDRLQTLRGVLRERMRDSPLMDAERYARDVESAYREMWRRWCAANPR